jgi:hypothetical protein
MAELLESAGERRLLHLDGHLVLVERAESLNAARAEVEALARHGVRRLASIRRGEGAGARARAPIEGAWHYRDTGHVDDPYAVPGIRGGRLRAATSFGDVASIERKGRVRCSHFDGRAIDATHAVLARRIPEAACRAAGLSRPLDTERAIT